MLKSCEVSDACVCVCFRSRSGFHCISEGSQSDAGGPAVGGALLLHAAAARTGQSGDQHTLYLCVAVHFLNKFAGVTWKYKYI